MGPITPQALGGFKYATKFVDQQTKWKEISPIKEKPQTIDSLELYNKAFVIPTGDRLVRVKTDKGTEFTDTVFPKHYLDIAGIVR